MSFGSRSLVLAAVLAVTLACATGARADTFTFTYSGPDISGTATLQATSEGSGVYLVTSITGSQTLDGVTQTITGLVPTSAGNALYYYDNLIYPTQTPAIDIDGLLFTVTGESAPVNICGATTTACEYTYAEYTYGAGDSPSSAY